MIKNATKQVIHIVALVGCLMITGCIDDESKSALDGTILIGSFMRGGPLIYSIPTQVVLNMGNGTFEGFSTKPNYPAICKGTYTLSGTTITFKNTCAFTADFDWTLILDGEYAYEKNGKSIHFRRSYENNTVDWYVLKISH